jgi:hypothetical protein
VTNPGRALALAVALNVSGSFQWPLPESWRQETIPFPLEFAPDLPYEGVEELRFSPGMFKPDHEGYWSYAFVWWLDGRPALDAPELTSTLRRYFAGLCTSVAKEKGQPIDPAKFSVSVQAVAGPQRKLGHVVAKLAGTVDSYDPFATGKPIVLNVEVWVWDCDRSGKRAAIVLASPKPVSAPIWTSLRKRRDEFVCHKR